MFLRDSMHDEALGSASDLAPFAFDAEPAAGTDGDDFEESDLEFDVELDDDDDFDDDDDDDEDEDDDDDDDDDDDLLVDDEEEEDEEEVED
jgi:hypothetical protein